MNLNREYLDYVVICGMRLIWDEINANWSKLARDVGLTVTEEQVLWVISFSDSSTVTEIAYILQRDKGTISKCVYSLEQNGFLTRFEGKDRRFYEFTLTKAGSDLIKELTRRHSETKGLTVARALMELSKEERDFFARTIVKLVKRVYGEKYIFDLCDMLVVPKEPANFLKRLT